MTRIELPVIFNSERKAAEAVVDAAIWYHWVNDDMRVSNETRAVWIESVLHSPETTPKLFICGGLSKGSKNK